MTRIDQAEPPVVSLQYLEAKNGEWYFLLLVGNDKVMRSTDSFPTKQHAARASDDLFAALNGHVKTSHYIDMEESTALYAGMELEG